jgi:hypothetical protein
MAPSFEKIGNIIIQKDKKQNIGHLKDAKQEEFSFIKKKRN